MNGFVSPASLAEALALLQEHPQARLMAGGTDLLVRLRSEAPSAQPLLIGLERVAELRGIEEISERGEWLSIGACTSFAQLIASPLLAEHTPILVTAARSVGAPAIRNMATLGGNLCTASPAGDALPPLYALGAEVELTSTAGSRRMPVRQFVIGPARTVLAADEILSRVLLPRRPPYSMQRFEKIGKRESQAIAVVSFAGLLRLDDRRRITEARFAWGSVGPTVLTLPEVERVLCGQIPDAALLRQTADLVRESVRPIDDLRASASYRRKLAGNLLRRFLSAATG